MLLHLKFLTNWILNSPRLSASAVKITSAQTTGVCKRHFCDTLRSLAGSSDFVFIETHAPATAAAAALG